MTKTRYYFVSTVLFYIAYLVVLQAEWLLKGEPWAEMSTNYYFYAHSSSIIEQLFATDAGYIPFPQRLIALIGRMLNMGAALTPYWYTWTAIVGAGMLVATFCLPLYRPVVANDELRLLAALAALIVPEFEAKTFINFSYFGAFFISINAALALIDPERKLPLWLWLTPLLMFSKPALLATVPAVAVAGYFGNAKYRRIALISLVSAALQLVCLFVNHQSGEMDILQNNALTVSQKLTAVVQYVLGFSASLFLGPNFKANIPTTMSIGIFIISLCTTVIRCKNKNSAILMGIGLSLLFNNILINCFGISAIWNLNAIQLTVFTAHKHLMVGYFGMILMILALITRFANGSTSNFKNLGVFAFSIWLIAGGWLNYAVDNTKDPGFPMTGSSYWQTLSTQVDDDTLNCIPVDPLGWTYTKTCSPLNMNINWLREFEFTDLSAFSTGNFFETKPDPALNNKTLEAFAILARPINQQRTPIRVTATLNMIDGSHFTLQGERISLPSGTLIFLNAMKKVAMNTLSSVKFAFDQPVAIAFTTKESSKADKRIWSHPNPAIRNFVNDYYRDTHDIGVIWYGY